MTSAAADRLLSELDDALEHVLDDLKHETERWDERVYGTAVHSYERGSPIWSTRAELFGDGLRWSTV